MKRLFTSFFLVCLFNFIHADIIPIGQKTIGYCVKIQNADSFPDVSIILVVKPISNTNYEHKEIKSSDCLNMGYKFNNSSIYSINKTYLNKKGIDAIDYFNDKNALLTNISVPALTFQIVQEDSPVKSISEFYRVLGFNDTSTIIYLCKRISLYNDDHRDSVLFSIPAGYDDLKNNIVISTTNVKAIEKSSKLLIYPSPSQEYLNLNMNDDNQGKVSVELSDIEGRKISIYNFIKNQVELKITMDIRSLRSGIYNLRYSVGNYIENRLFLKK